MSTQVDPQTGRVTYLGTGIGNLAAARRYLHRKFRDTPLPPVQRRPGARFYVTVRRGCRPVFLLGPYVSHMTALSAVPRAARLARDRYGDVAAFAAIGTASRPTTVATLFGR